MKETVEQLKQRAEQLLRQSDVKTNERINALNDVAWGFRFVNGSLAAQLRTQALQLAERNGYQRGRAFALHNIGWSYICTDQCQKAEQNLEESFQIFSDLEDEPGLASTINALATVNKKTGDHEKALERYSRALQLRRKIGDNLGVASTLANLSGVAARLGDYWSSLDCCYGALRTALDWGASLCQALAHLDLSDVLWRVGEAAQAIKHSQQAFDLQQGQLNRVYQAPTLVNMGAAYQSQGEYQTALEKYLRGLEIACETDNYETQAEAQMCIGSVYYEIGDWQTALLHLTQASQISQTINSRFYKSESLFWIGSVYKQLGDVSQSIEALTEALDLTRQINANEIRCKTHLALSEAYQEQNRFAEALHHHKAFHQTWQEVFGIAASRRVERLLQQELKAGQINRLKSPLAMRSAKSSALSDGQNIALSPRKLQDIKDFIARHPEQNLTLAELANMTGLSQNYFLRSFKNSTGKTPHQFIIEQRVARAKELLQTSVLPLAEIALVCGFSSQSHLTTHFRLLTGATPRQFQRRFHTASRNKS